MRKKLLNVLKSNLEYESFDEENFLIEVNQHLNGYNLEFIIDENYCLIQNKENINLFKVYCELYNDDEIIITGVELY